MCGAGVDRFARILMFAFFGGSLPSLGSSPVNGGGKKNVTSGHRSAGAPHAVRNPCFTLCLASSVPLSCSRDKGTLEATQREEERCTCATFICCPLLFCLAILRERTTLAFSPRAQQTRWNVSLVPAAP